MKTTIFRAAIAALAALGIGSSGAAEITTSATAPTVDGLDIANLVTPTGSNLIWNDRGVEGNTFTTGASGGILKAVTVQLHESDGELLHWTDYRVRVGTVDTGPDPDEITFTVDDVTRYDPASGFTTSDHYMTLTLDTPETLAPNTLYAFDVSVPASGHAWQDGIQSLRKSGNDYADGSSYVAGKGSTPTNNPTYRTGDDLIFHLDIDSATPDPFQLVITPNATTAGNYDFEWKDTKDSKIYDLVSALDLSTAPGTWPVYLGNENIPGTAPTNTLMGIAGGGDPGRYFAVVEKDPPPPVLQNGSFEEPVVSVDGEIGLLGSPWAETDPGTGSVDTWNPPASDYDPLPDGDNVGSVFFIGTAPGSPFGAKQVLGETFTAGTDYSVTVQVGRSVTYDWPGFRVELWAGAVLLASDEDPTTTAPTAGNFVPSALSYDHTTGPAATPGDALEIRLLSRGVDVDGTTGNGWAVDFDQVEFSSMVP